MKPSTLRTAFLLGLGLATICGRGAWAQNAKDSPIGKWNLKGYCWEVRLVPTALVPAPRAPVSFLPPSECDEEHAMKPPGSFRESIPLGSITAIVREIVARKPVQERINENLSSVKPENLISTIGEAAEGAGEAAVFAPAAPVFLLAEAGAMAPFRGVRTHIESVRLLWTENHTPRSTVLVLARKDVESLLNRLAHATAKSWTEVRFDSEAKDEHASQVLVHFSEPVSAGDITVSAGNYRLLMIVSSDSTHLVYWFSEGKQLPQDAMAVFTAEASPLGNGKPWKIQLSHDAEGSWCPSEIDTDLERLHLQVCKALTNPSPQP